MASRSALVALLVVVSCASAASAETFTVGDSQGWATGVDYTIWTSGKTFAANDTLVFNFGTGQHTVDEVSKSDYDTCSSSNTINTVSTGPATITLAPGTHYYICGISGHCASGMKLAVNVGSGSGSPATPATPATPGTPSTPTASTPTGASARLQAGPALAVAAGVLFKLALF
ncbi:blue copper protein-like [Phragmites australis]|uniref:blue copper protein-like n=1 Tax=Phragmites australis TaxID=29695 RepID=UPI002D78F8F1|nr:blue copper protein-like [Phragmites australis]